MSSHFFTGFFPVGRGDLEFASVGTPCPSPAAHLLVSVCAGAGMG